MVKALAYYAYVGYVERMGFRPGPMDFDYEEKLGRLEAWVLPGDGRLDGLIVFEPDAGRLWVDNVAVHPEAQGRGIGRGLLELAEERARELELEELRLFTHETMVENQAIYAHLGWEEYERRSEDGFARVWFRKATPGPDE